MNRACRLGVKTCCYRTVILLAASPQSADIRRWIVHLCAGLTYRFPLIIEAVADCQLGLLEPVRNVPGTNQAFYDITTV
jgi:hypothetical protein